MILSKEIRVPDIFNNYIYDNSVLEIVSMEENGKVQIKGSQIEKKR